MDILFWIEVRRIWRQEKRFHVAPFVEEFTDSPTMMDCTIVHHYQHFVVRITLFYFVKKVQE